jgi:hypothetical protein
MIEQSFRPLAAPGSIRGVAQAFHVAFYHPVRAGYQDPISKYLLDFSHGIEPQMSRWVMLAAPLVVKAGSFDVILRMPQTNDDAPPASSPLDRLCETIAGQCGSEFMSGRLELSEQAKTSQKPGRQAGLPPEPAGQFRFNGEGLPPNAKILVVDSIMKTTTAMETVAEAIHAELPGAEVSCFVLGKADPKSRNTHLNPEYFVSPDGQEHQPLLLPVGTTFSSPVQSEAAPTGMLARKAASRSVLQQVPAGRERSKFWLYLAGVALFVLIIGALVPLKSGKKSVTTLTPLAEAPPAIEVKETFEPSRTSLEPSGQGSSLSSSPFGNQRQGLVTVPGVGLRPKHAMNSKPLPQTMLRNGERVAILKKYDADAGPDWVQIQTKTGKVGWVFASVVKEAKPRK